MSRSRREQKPGLFDGDFGSEHQAHHTDTRYFTPTERKVKAAAVALGALGTLGSLAFGPRRALSFVAGFGITYASYEILHRRTHTHAPTGPYGRWARKHHLSHHFSNPATNHGVTSPIWDLVFGTYADHGKMRVPRRHAPLWLLGWSSFRPKLQLRFRPAPTPGPVIGQASSSRRRKWKRLSRRLVGRCPKRESGNEPACLEPS